jgi:hypothetical protein
MTDERRPIDPRGRALPPRVQPGYYPEFSTLAQQAYWDEATRATVLARVEHVPAIRFFTADQATLLAAVVDRVMPQDDRDAAHRIPIVPFIDERLHLGVTDGYRYEDMPADGEAHRLGLVAIDAIAVATYAHPFAALDSTSQDLVLKQIHDGEAPAAAEIWKRMPTHRYWMLLVNDVCQVYYAHPWAWDEIGFGGPAYPRGYMRLERGQREPWEVDEQRYSWEPPTTARSTAFEPVGGASGHAGTSGQGGTH